MPRSSGGCTLAESRLAALAASGQSVWIDVLSRSFVRSGELAGLIEHDAVSGVTSNPTIFEKAIESGDYDADVVSARERGADPRETFFELALADVQAACDLLAAVHRASGGNDGFVSLEVDPALAQRSSETVSQALDLHRRIGRDNAFIKIPATREGLEAIEECIAQGVSINVTLIFSLERYAEVTRAYRRGLERLASSGGDLRSVSSVASFFVSRLDTEADRLLERQQRSDLVGRLGIASARLAYARFRELFSGPEWERLASAGASRQRLLWASTSTKNPAYRDVMYVEELIGPETIDTMPPETLAAFRDHGEVRGETISEGVAEAEALFGELEQAGVSVAEITEKLETDGVKRFADSFEQALARIESKHSELVAR